jgi:hypothetical protein
MKQVSEEVEQAGEDKFLRERERGLGFSSVEGTFGIRIEGSTIPVNKRKWLAVFIPSLII